MKEKQNSTMTIGNLFNAHNEQQVEIEIDELEINSGSSKGRLVETNGLEPSTSCV